MALNIEVGSEYKITSDERNVILNRKHIVDPTKSPAFDPEKHSAELRTEYREPKYHSSMESALKSLIERATLDGQATTLAELLGEIKQYKREIKRLMTVEGN